MNNYIKISTEIQLLILHPVRIKFSNKLNGEMKHKVVQGLAVLAADAGWEGCFLRSLGGILVWVCLSFCLLPCTSRTP